MFIQNFCKNLNYRKVINNEDFVLCFNLYFFRFFKNLSKMINN